MQKTLENRRIRRMINKLLRESRNKRLPETKIERLLGGPGKHMIRRGSSALFFSDKSLDVFRVKFDEVEKLGQGFYRITEWGFPSLLWSAELVIGRII